MNELCRSKQTASLPGYLRGLVAAIMLVGGMSSADAAIFNFKTYSGGQQVPAISNAGAYVYVEVIPDPANPGIVLFRFVSRIPQPVSTIVRIVFDLGVHRGLFSSMAISQQLGADFAPSSTGKHAYLGDLNPSFAFAPAGGGQLYDPKGLQPGELVTVAAVLSPGRNFGQVAAAMNQGISPNPAVARSGLRIGLIAHHLLGKRPDPKVTIMDDAGFVLSSMVRQ